MGFQRIGVEEVKPDFAAQVHSGVDLRRRLPDEVLAEVRAAWAAFPVLCFPDQPLSLDELEAFTLQIGPYGVDPFIAPMEGHPNVLELRREKDEKSIVFGASWHSDWSFQPEPPSATLLHSKVVPPIGGDTLYADMRSAYDALPDDLREAVLGHRARHSAKFAYGTSGVFAKDENPRGMKILSSEDAHTSEVHPMVRTHPATGRRALFVNPVYTTGVEGVSDEESYTLLVKLYEHCTSERFVHRHRWQENMLVMWDNRCAIHNAQGGYDGHLRLMHRTTVAGEKPFLSV